MFLSRQKREPSGERSGDWVEEKLTLVQWNIARYDQIRSSTGSRAALLVSANALLLTGTTVLLNAYNGKKWPDGWLDRSLVLAFVVALISTLTATLASIWHCIGAISAYRTHKTSRRTFQSRLPSRVIYNWGDTLRIGDYDEFSRLLHALTPEDALSAASAELWSAIYQHSKKHRYLRVGIRLFRVALVAFFLLGVVATMRKVLG